MMCSIGIVLISIGIYGQWLVLLPAFIPSFQTTRPGYHERSKEEESCFGDVARDPSPRWGILDLSTDGLE